MSLLLSLISGGRNKAEAAAACGEASCCVVEADAADMQLQDPRNGELLLPAVQGLVFSGGGSFHPVSVRTTHAGRRTSPQPRSTFRILKGGRVIDNNRIHPFLASAFVLLSGTHISARYLLSICRLRL